MIISHQHRFIFVAVPKTGTHSVREVLRPRLGPEDEEQARLFVDKKFSDPVLASLGHGHISLSQLRAHMDRGLFDTYLKFAFVRNPFARFVSYCAFVSSKSGAFERDPKAVMHQTLAAPPRGHIIFQPQHQFLADSSGTLLTDFVGRVENMQHDFDTICQRLGIPSSGLGHKNSSQHGDYRSYYDQELIDGVGKFFARDLELFGYDF